MTQTPALSGMTENDGKTDHIPGAPETVGQ